MRGDENEFGRLQRFRYGDGHAVRIHAIGSTIAIEAKRRNDRQNVLCKQSLEQFRIDPLDLAREKVIHALKNPHRISGDRIGARGTKIVSGQPFENFVGESIRRSQRKLQCRRIRDPGSVDVRWVDPLLLGEVFDLSPRAMDQHHANVQRAKHRHIGENRGKVFFCNNRSVDAENKNSVAKARDVLKNTPEISWFHLELIIFSKTARQRRFSSGVPMEMRIHSGSL